MSSADTQQSRPNVIESDGDAFDILATLGQGGMGVVYKAHQHSLERTVAIKVLHKSQALDTNLGARLRREAQIAAQLTHPNVVRVHSIGVAKDMPPFIIMEYVDGRGLDTILDEQKTLELDQFWSIFLPLTDALQAIHELGMIHRDIKPSNILVTTNGAPKLMDFGIAKSLNQTAEQKMTQTGAMVGSPAYMSPEQCSSAELDARSDIYSLGCTMYQSLCGEPPFASENPLEVMFAHLHEQARTLGGVDPRISEVVARCIAKDPADRFQTAAELKEALLSCRSGSYVSTRIKKKRKTPRFRKKQLQIAAAVGSVALCALVMCSLQTQHKTTRVDTNESEQLAKSRGASAIENWAEDEISQICREAEKGRLSDAEQRRRFQHVCDEVDAGLIRAKQEGQSALVVQHLQHWRAIALDHAGTPEQAEEAWLKSVQKADEAYASGDEENSSFRGKRIEEYVAALSFMNTKQRFAHFDELYNKAMDLAREHEKESEQAVNSQAALLLLKANMHASRHEMRQAEAARREAIQKLESASPPLNETYTEAQAFWDLTFGLSCEHKAAEAVKEAERALKNTTAKHYLDRVREIRGDIANIAATEACSSLHNRKLTEQFFQAEYTELNERNASPQEKALSLGRQSARLWAFGDLDGAIKLSEQAIVLWGPALYRGPDGANQVAFLSDLYLIKNDFRKLVALTEPAIEPAYAAVPGNPVAAFNLAVAAEMANYALQNYEKAIALGNRAIALAANVQSPTLPNLRYEAEHFLALSYDKLGKKSEAVEHAELARSATENQHPRLIDPSSYNRFRNDYARITGKNLGPLQTVPSGAPPQ